MFDAGNYNEAGFEGSSEALVEIYTNGIMEAGYRAMSWMAENFGESESIRYAEFARTLEESIEGHFAGEPGQGYWNGIKWPTCEKIEMLNWLPLLARHWHKGNPADMDKLWGQLKEKTSIDWGGMRVVTCEVPRDQYKLVGRIYASQMAFFVETGRLNELKSLIEFASKTITHPLNLFPEWWFHHRPENPRGCLKASIEHHSGFYESYCDNPDGDYTYDSGNCEQCACFLHDVWSSLAGIVIRPDYIRVAPALCSPMSLEHGPQGLTWHWDGKDDFDFQMDKPTDWQVRLPVAQDYNGHAEWNGNPVAFQRIHGKEIDWLDFQFTACEAGKVTLSSAS